MLLRQNLSCCGAMVVYVFFLLSFLWLLMLVYLSSQEEFIMMGESSGVSDVPGDPTPEERPEQFYVYAISLLFMLVDFLWWFCYKSSSSSSISSSSISFHHSSWTRNNPTNNKKKKKNDRNNHYEEQPQPRSTYLEDPDLEEVEEEDRSHLTDTETSNPTTMTTRGSGGSSGVSLVLDQHHDHKNHDPSSSSSSSSSSSLAILEDEPMSESAPVWWGICWIVLGLLHLCLALYYTSVWILDEDQMGRNDWGFAESISNAMGHWLTLAIGYLPVEARREQHGGTTITTTTTTTRRIMG